MTVTACSRSAATSAEKGPTGRKIRRAMSNREVLTDCRW